MIDMMGGEKAFSAKLDRNFEEDHYRHDNEPGHHYIYLYNYCNEPWKTQELARKHVRINYKNSPDGVMVMTIAVKCPPGIFSRQWDSIR